VIVDIVFDIANVAFIIGSGLLIYSINKNRNILKGFQPVGSLLTLTAMSFVQYAYVIMGNWLSFFLSLPTVILWAFASIYSIRNYFRRNN
jgi:hypothetical protein